MQHSYETLTKYFVPVVYFFQMFFLHYMPFSVQ